MKVIKEDMVQDVPSYSIYDCVKLENGFWVIITSVNGDTYTGITENDILEDQFTPYEFTEEEIKWAIEPEYLGVERYQEEVAPLIDKVKAHENSSSDPIEEKLIGYKITAKKDGQTFDDYMCAYEEEGALRQMKNKYGKDIEIIHVDDSRVIKECVYREHSSEHRVKWSHK